MQSPADIFGEVFRAIWAHKLRAFLTMFGIAWGVGSMLLLIGFGEGFRSGQRRQMASLGNNVIMMWGGNIPAVPSQHTGMRPYKLTLADEAAVRAGAPEVRNITAMLQNTTIKEVSDESSSSGEVTGVEPNYSEIRFVPVAEGRFLRVRRSGAAPPGGRDGQEDRRTAFSRPAGAGGMDTPQRSAIPGHRGGGQHRAWQQ